MYTTEAKLSKLMKTKGDIVAAIQAGGVEIPGDTPFGEFPEYIRQLLPEITDTTSLADLMVLADLYQEVDIGLYEEHAYTEQEETELMNLINLIVEGEE